MSALKIPVIQSLLTVKTRSFEVELFNMDDEQEYARDRDALVMTGSVQNDGIEELYLLLTNHRVAAVVSTPKGTKVFVWNWMNGKPCFVSRSIPLPKMS